MPKVRYEVDPHSRLIIKKTGRKSQVPKYRHVADGRFKIGKKNSLTYHIKKSKDGFSYETKDGSLSAHFEHTIAVTDVEPEVLTIL